MNMNTLAKRISRIEWSGIRTMHSKADDIEGTINLGIGQPDFDTPDHIKDAAKLALDEGYTGYPPAQGYDDLRRVISKKLARDNKIIADPDKEVMITVGAMQVIFHTMMNFIEHGDEVIVMEPGYEYLSQIWLFGGTPVSVPLREENKFKVDPDDIRKVVTNKTKMIILNSPSNPTGALFDREIIEEIAKIAMEHNIYVFSDEPYEDLIYDGKEHVSIASIDGMKDLTVTAYSLSKTYAMTGWRIGYAVASEKVITEMEKMMEHLVSGVTSIAQRAAIAAIDGPQDCVRQMAAAYEERRHIVYEGLNAIDGVSCTMPEATFYAFPNMKATGLPSWELAEYLLKEHKVITAPGLIFGKPGEGHLRLSFAAKNETLKEGLRRIQQGVEELTRKRAV